MMEEKIKNILVTGGCGFIGSNFIRYLYKRYLNYRIFNLDTLTYAANEDNLSDIEEPEEIIDIEKRRYHFVKGDICDTLFLENLFQKHSFDSVVHFAAETHVDRSFFNVSNFIRTNIDGTHLLIEVVRKYNVPRFIHVSTDEVYGSIPHGLCCKENSLFNPSNPYSTSKACADLLVQSYMRTYRVPAIIIRGSNNFGPYQYPEKFIPLAITNIIDEKKIPIHGNGEHSRSWLHVDDFCSAIGLVMHHAPVGSIYNASGEERTNLEILKMVVDAMDVDINKYKDHVNDRPGADFRYAPDSAKLKNELGWKPQYFIDENIKQVIEWYLQNKEWWQKIKSKKEYQDHYVKQSQGKWY